MKNLSLAIAVVLYFPSSTLAMSPDLTSKKVCELGQPRCVDVVIRQMQRRYRPLARQCNHNALFALTYLRTTEVFGETLDEVDYNDPVAVIREDALFAEYYFRAYDTYHSGKGSVPEAWLIAFSTAQSRSVSGSGNLILGFNAHIQRDLPFVLYELYLQGHPVSYSDHTRVNQFLQRVNVLEELAQRFDPTIDDEDKPGQEDDQQRFQLIAQWREGAYRNFERLRDAKTKEERRQVAAEIEGNAAGTANLLRQAFSYPPGENSSERDAYCRVRAR